MSNLNRYFHYQNANLCAEQVELDYIAQHYSTPTYVYSKSAIEQSWQALDQSFSGYPHTICYAVKANSNLAILSLLAKLGSGFDIVSEGELRRVIAAGGDCSKVVFSGVAKSYREIRFAIENEIRSIHVESIAELERIQQVAQQLNKKVSVSIRVNPDVDPQTHPYISTGMEEAKFGINMRDAYDVCLTADSLSHIQIDGIACHIGSQITKLSPFKDAFEIVMQMVVKLKQQGVEIQHLDLGGGLGIDYQGERIPDVKDYVDVVVDLLKKHKLSLPITLEPGRMIVGNAGVLLTKVEYLKKNLEKQFAIVDAGMNDLMRPSLYQAFHNITPIVSRETQDLEKYDVVGPVCESSCVLGANRLLKISAGDVLAIHSAGAYAFSMASNYNSRLRPAEVLVDQDKTYLIRKRDAYEQLTENEVIPDYS